MNAIVSYYDELAARYDEDRFQNTYGEFIDRQERYILGKLLKPGEYVLDLACGSGRLTNYANAGADASANMIDIARKKYPDKEFFVAAADKLPFADGTFDMIISFHFFMHLDKESVIKILAECHRVLKPNGRMIFDIPSKKRRKLIQYKSQNWHGNLSFSLREISTIQKDMFTFKRSFGLVLFPIHRIATGLRKLFLKADKLFANSFLKEYSSYFIIELQKK